MNAIFLMLSPFLLAFGAAVLSTAVSTILVKALRFERPKFGWLFVANASGAGAGLVLMLIASRFLPGGLTVENLYLRLGLAYFATLAATFSILCVSTVQPGKRRSMVVGIVPTAIIFGALWCGLTEPLVKDLKEAQNRACCKANLKWIGEALLDYHDAHDRFPPAHIADESGQPKHSWRVLILPFLAESALHERYDSDEAWDSPANRAVVDTPLFTYTCPANTEDTTETNYVMIVRPGTISDGTNSTRVEDVTDGASQTIMIVEVTGTGIHWAEPRDLSAEEISYQISNPGHVGVGSGHKGGAHVLLCDGSVLFLSDSTDPKFVRGLTTIGGGEDLEGFSEDR